MKRWKSLVCVAALAIAVTAAPARAQSEASLVLSALPVASIVVGGSVGAAAVSAVRINGSAVSLPSQRSGDVVRVTLP